VHVSKGKASHGQFSDFRNKQGVFPQSTDSEESFSYTTTEYGFSFAVGLGS
jgi:hypothetical protein